MEKTVIVNDVPVHVYENGAGHPILILHGWGSSALSWNAVVDELERNGFHTYTPDLPGFGQSPEPPAEWDLQNYTEMVHRLIAELGLKQCNVVGHSFGGRIAIQLAHKHPDDVQNLVLCGAAGIQRHLTLKVRILRFISKIGKSMFSLPIISRLYHPVQKGVYFISGKRDYYRASTTMKQVMGKSIEHELKDLLPHIQHKTLLLWGDKDNATPLQDAQLAESLLPNSTLKVFEGKGHSLQRQSPVEIAEHIVNFVNQS